MTYPTSPGVQVGDLSPDATHMWDGDAWNPLWLLPDDVMHAVRVCFGRTVTAPCLLGEGLLNQSWRIDAPDRRYVLRVSRPERLWEQVAYEHALIRALHEQVNVAIVPIHGRDGETVQQWRTNILSLFPYVEASSGTAVAAEARKMQTATVLAQIHRASVTLGFGQRPGWHAVDDHPRFIWSKVRPALERDLADVPDLAEVFSIFDHKVSELNTWLDGLHLRGRSLLRAPIHGDFNPRNFLFDHDQLIGVIDWDHCRTDPLAWEVAQVGFGDPEHDPRTFFQHYLEAGGPLTPDDFALLSGFARVGILSEVQWAVTSLSTLR